MKETNLLKIIQLTLSKFPNVRLFRNNVGQGWIGSSVNRGGTVTITDARPLHAGLCPGSSDLIGFTIIDITPDMVGQRVAVFTAIEGKLPGRKATPEQINFIRVVREAGGYAGVARTPAEAQEITRNR